MIVTPRIYLSRLQNDPAAQRPQAYFLIHLLEVRSVTLELSLEMGGRLSAQHRSPVFGEQLSYWIVELVETVLAFL